MKSLGFTLIELLIVVSIMAIFAGVGSYLSIQSKDNAALRSSSELLKNHLIEARMSAWYGKKPKDCTGDFAGVEFSNTQRGYTIKSKCDPDTPNATTTLVSVSFDNPTVVFSTENTFMFYPLLQGGISAPGDVSLTLSNNQITQNPVVITKAGDIHSSASRFSCTGLIPANATICERDDQDLTTDTPRTLVTICKAALCEYTCNQNYVKSGNACIGHAE